MLEDELTSILIDDDIRQLIISDSAEQQELAGKLRSQNRPFLITDFEGASNLAQKHRSTMHSNGQSRIRYGLLQRLLHQQDDLVVVVHVLRLGLHIDSSSLSKKYIAK